jgi:hypothetical protein
LGDALQSPQAFGDETFISGQLTELGKALTEEVTAFTTGREVHLNATTPEPGSTTEVFAGGSEGF